VMSGMEFCVICGVPRGDHPAAPPPGPPDPPPQHHEGVWRPRHAFKPSELTFAEVLEERDAQIKHWRSRAYAAERRIRAAREALDA
jgi:hypothetical protein